MAVTLAGVRARLITKDYCTRVGRRHLDVPPHIFGEPGAYHFRFAPTPQPAFLDALSRSFGFPSPR